MALKPPFSSLYYYSEVSGSETSSWCRPLHGLSYPWVSGGNTVDVSTWRRLNLATSPPGDPSTWRRLNLATPQPGDALSWRCLVLVTPCPGDGSRGQPIDFLPWDPLMGPTTCLTLTLVNARGRDGTENGWKNTSFANHMV